MAFKHASQTSSGVGRLTSALARSTALVAPAVALAGLLAPMAAQAADASATDVQAVVVTGSRIPQPNLTSSAPVAVVSNAEVKFQGITRSEDLLNDLPQVFASQGSTISNGSNGTANVNLRNLGSGRTLVLIDGKRAGPGDPQSPSADLNMIPPGLIDHVEVLTGGASSTYGADAVAGVVNFVMKKNYEGVQIDVQHSLYQHDNNDGNFHTILAAKGDAIPASSVTDGNTDTINLLMGVNSPDKKGNITISGTYTRQEAISQANRDFSACTVGASNKFQPNYFSCSGSGTTSPAHFYVYDANGNPVGTSYEKNNGLIVSGSGIRDYNSATDTFNYGPINYFQRPDTRYSFGANGHYEINKYADVYASFMFMDDHTVAQIAPSGVFGQLFSVPCNNPLLSASQVAAFCTAAGLGPTDSANLAILRRNVEGGGRQSDLRHTDYRFIVGSKGELNSAWTYDVSGQYSSAVLSEEYKNDVSLLHAANALNVVNVNGVPTCASVVSGLDTSCVPWNIFSAGGVTPAALAYIGVPGFQRGETTEQIVTGSVVGDLGEYGVKSPWATNTVKVSLGAEYRRETETFDVDNEFASGDLAGQGGPTLGNQGSFDVKELFGEISLPLAQDKAWIKSLQFDGGYRWSDYSTGVTTDTYRGALEYRPVDELLLRASYNRAVKAPTIQNLYIPQSVGNDGSLDPCAGATPTATAAQCAFTGVSAAQYGNIAANPASQYNGLTGGNPVLKPETADTYSYGAVFTPKFLPGFSLSIDYYDIQIRNVIGSVGADYAIQQCVATGAPFFCSLVHRAPGSGSLWLGTTGYITDTTANTGGLSTKGVDVEANYRFTIPTVMKMDLGRMNANFVGSYYKEAAAQALPGQPWYDCAGYYGPVCGAPQAKWRHKLRLTWSSPWDFQVSGDWRYTSEAKRGTSTAVVAANAEGDARLPSKSYFDLSGTWKVKEGYTLRAGVNNVLDTNPPLVTGLGAGQYNGNTFPQVYDSLGRYFFVGLTADF